MDDYFLKFTPNDTNQKGVKVKLHENEDDTFSIGHKAPVDHMPVGTKYTIFNEIDKQIDTTHNLLMAFKVKDSADKRARQVTVSFGNSGLKTISVETWNTGTLGGGAAFVDNGQDSILEVIEYDSNFTFTPTQGENL